MSKAALVMEMPENCLDNCPCIDDIRCAAVPESIIGMDGSRPDWCPLRPLPEKDSASALDDHLTREMRKRLEYFIAGWNACLDEITGGSKDDRD